MKVKQLSGKARGSDELKKAKGETAAQEDANYAQPKGSVQKNDTRAPWNLMKVRKRQMESGKRDRREWR